MGIFFVDHKTSANIDDAYCKNCSSFNRTCSIDELVSNTG